LTTESPSQQQQQQQQQPEDVKPVDVQPEPAQQSDAEIQQLTTQDTVSDISLPEHASDHQPPQPQDNQNAEAITPPPLTPSPVQNV